MDIDKTLHDLTADQTQYASNPSTTSVIHPRLPRTAVPQLNHAGNAGLLFNQAGDHSVPLRPLSTLSVRFAAENEHLELPPIASDATPPSSKLPFSHGSSGSSSISSSSVHPSLYTSTITTYNSSSTGSSSPPPPHLSSGISTTPEPASPPESAFVSASTSPFTPALASLELPPEVDLDQAALPQVIPSPKHHPAPPPPQSGTTPEVAAAHATLSTVDDKFLELQFVKPDGYPRSQQPITVLSVEQATSSTQSDLELHSKPLARAHFERAPPTPIISTSPSTSFRPRTCDVYIGIHGYTSSLSRFSKWLRAELEFQGIACFLADRARYSDPRVHDIARRIMHSCTFGVIVVNKKTFKNMYSVEELQIFLERKNLVPLFFDLAPTDCMARDIVERRGEVWEKEGGDLWRTYGGKEREWREAIDGLSRIEEWKLEAFNGNWRDCILRAVSLLGTRIGRRSVAERERARKQRVEREEFPFPRNAHFVGREKEIRAVERFLFGNANELTQNLVQQPDASKILDNGGQKSSRQSKQGFRVNRRQIISQSERWLRPRTGAGNQTSESFESRRRSDADMWHSRCMMEGTSESTGEYVGRRKSDSDRWQSFVAAGGLDIGFSRKNTFETWFASKGDGADYTSSAKRATAISKVPEIKEVPDDYELNNGMSRQKSRHSSRDNKNRNLTSNNARRRKTQGSRSKSESAVSSSSMQEEEGTLSKSINSASISVCVCGGAGMGKTELALEFSYRYSQRYRTVLWIGGEARYLRQNYLNLSVLLGLDVGTESQVGPERGRTRTFEEQEREALHRVRRELERDVPYLLVIDNLESERDWWDRKEVVELLPRPGSGGATHVIVTTRLHKMASMPNAVKLLYLSSAEALSLMRGKRELSVQELDALKEMEERLDRSTFGLALVGKLLAEVPGMMPSVLLEKVNKGFPDSWASIPREDTSLKNNTFLLKLLGVCFSFLEQLGGPRKLAIRMACIGGWCAPFPIPVSLLGAAAIDLPEHSTSLVARVFRDSVLFCGTTQTKRAESEAGSLLVRLGIARSCTKQGWIFFDEILQLYARKRGGPPAARAMVQGIKKRGVISQHSEHFWAACFLVFGFANDPVIVDLRAVELLSFIKKGALQLAFRAFTTFSRCRAALELLRLCTNMLEDVEKSFVSQTQDWWGRSLCWRASSTHNYMIQQAASGMRRPAGTLGNEVDEYVWEEATLLKALLLETRAKLLLKGGQFDAGEEICRTCISIRVVMLGENHPDTISAQDTLAKLVRARSNI
ncbi:hypothetical protein GOP47_0014154 [Adiantum capillus-veneris]|uniref:TIR domain-containing protein n=1 Tax=Adiantum capillus-veneris TaxID=13818 RepID=A0A9D4ZDW6_ADICA|nr:hypothetical protein GOP47_0014154 [Adiantum capillus-veneris]